MQEPDKHTESDHPAAKPAHTRSTVQEHDAQYERLRKWYLARLRKTALASLAADDMTPATLVKLDHAPLQAALAQATPETKPKPNAPYTVSSAKPLNWFSFFTSYWVTTLVMTVLLIFQLKQFDFSAAAACIPSLFLGPLAPSDLPFPFPAAPLIFVGWPTYLIVVSLIAGFIPRPTKRKRIDLDGV